MERYILRIFRANKVIIHGIHTGNTQYVFDRIRIPEYGNLLHLKTSLVGSAFTMLKHDKKQLFINIFYAFNKYFLLFMVFSLKLGKGVLESKK